jgi:hypothetical protein
MKRITWKLQTLIAKIAALVMVISALTIVLDECNYLIFSPYPYTFSWAFMFFSQ